MHVHQLTFPTSKWEVQFSITICATRFNIVTNMTIAGQRLGKHVPAAKNRRGINLRCYEGRSLQTNSVQRAFPWQQRGNRHYPLLSVDYTVYCIRSRAEKNDSIPCGGGVEYLHRSPASRRRRRKGKSRIWGSKIWSRVPRGSDLIMTALARTSSNCKRQRERSTSTTPATVWQ
jgi:hypothetical protein